MSKILLHTYTHRHIQWEKLAFLTNCASSTNAKRVKCGTLDQSISEHISA